LLAVPFAASAATRAAPAAAAAEADGDDLRDDVRPRPEWTISGTAQTQAYFMLPGVTLTTVTEHGVFELSGSYNPPRADGIYEIAGSLLGGWNHRLLGKAREGATLDGRLLAGATFAIENGGWLDLPLPGLAAAGELASTLWLSRDVGLSIAAQGGVNMVLLAIPTPMARLTVGLTF
jgi:hypothetical protein